MGGGLEVQNLVEELGLRNPSHLGGPQLLKIAYQNFVLLWIYPAGGLSSQYPNEHLLQLLDSLPELLEVRLDFILNYKIYFNFIFLDEQVIFRLVGQEQLDNLYYGLCLEAPYHLYVFHVLNNFKKF